MAIPLAQFLNGDALERLTKALSSIGSCGICHKPITDSHPDEVKKIGDKPVHVDCYYQELGGLIEKHPIHSPRIRRG